MDIGRTVFT